MTIYAAFIGLFSAAFLAGTVFPAQSEAVLAALLLSGDYSPWLLVLTATVGNTLGGVVNYTLGCFIDRFHDKKWFPFKEQTRARAQRWYQRYGKWSLLLSWLPFVGDPLTLAAGMMRENIFVFVVLVAIAKLTRYVVLMQIVS